MRPVRNIEPNREETHLLLLIEEVNELKRQQHCFLEEVANALDRLTILSRAAVAAVVLLGLELAGDVLIFVLR